MIHPGVDAPAVIPRDDRRANSSRESSLLRSTCRTKSQQLSHSWVSRLVLELLGSPMTIIPSHSSDKASASDCLLDVAPHIVSKKSAFVHTFFAFSMHFSQMVRIAVVWDTKVKGI